jgi:hypothetical protein
MNLIRKYKLSPLLASMLVKALAQLFSWVFPIAEAQNLRYQLIENLIRQNIFEFLQILTVALPSEHLYEERAERCGSRCFLECKGNDVEWRGAYGPNVAQRVDHGVHQCRDLVFLGGNVKLHEKAPSLSPVQKYCLLNSIHFGFRDADQAINHPDGYCLNDIWIRVGQLDDPVPGCLPCRIVFILKEGT